MICNLIIIICMIIVVVNYRKLSKSYNEVYDQLQESSKILMKMLTEQLAMAIGSIGNAPCEIREDNIGYDVIRKFEDSVYIIKRFTSEDKDYARRCAEELRDLINEEI